MSRREPKDRHGVERLKERYGIDLDESARKELLNLVRGCHWVPLELQGTRIRALLRYREQFVNLVFDVVDLCIVTALPLNEQDLTPEQFERARVVFPDIAKCAGAPEPEPSAPPKAAPRTPEPAVSFFDAVVLPRFGLDKKKALLWWQTPNHELGAETPGELAAAGKTAKIERMLERAKREKRPLLIPERKVTAKLNCKVCRGYPPPSFICCCEEDDAEGKE